MLKPQNAPGLLVGDCDFALMRKQGAYYVDKTPFIKSILFDNAHASLYVRPRRFGKSLMLSAMAEFLEMNYRNPDDLDEKRRLFDGLAIMQDQDFCKENFASWPVIFLTLKNIEGENFDKAAFRLKSLLSEVAQRYDFLLESDKLSRAEKRLLEYYVDMDFAPLSEAIDRMPDCLGRIEFFLAKHFGKPVIILIDEYDAPLQKARRNGYYEPLNALISSLLNTALKANSSLRKVVLSGCLRIAKESIYTGLNQITSFTMKSEENSGAFGFTSQEAAKMLKDFGLEQWAEEAKLAYDGYRFGSEEIYCPWDLVSFCRASVGAGRPIFDNYWINTSNNDILNEFLTMTDDNCRSIVKRLLNGDEAEVRIYEDLSYDDFGKGDPTEIFLSLLYATGYLASDGAAADGKCRLRIPNREVRDCFERKIDAFFSPGSPYFSGFSRRFADALVSGDEREAQLALTTVLERYISLRDGSSEAFYHGLVNGLLAPIVQDAKAGDDPRFSVLSNAEAGRGYADIILIDNLKAIGVVIELKKASGPQPEQLFSSTCKALEQIKDRNYAMLLQVRRIRTARLCGIAFSGKSCMLQIESTEIPSLPQQTPGDGCAPAGAEPGRTRPDAALALTP